MIKLSEKVVELKLPSEFGFEKVAMSSAAEVARKMGFSDDRIEDLKTAVSEACINAIEHGNKNNVNIKVIVLLRIKEDKLEITVKDQGKGISFKKNNHLLKLNKPNNLNETRRGWGMFLIKNLMDEVECEVDPKSGTSVKMIIHLVR